MCNLIQEEYILPGVNLDPLHGGCKMAIRGETCSVVNFRRMDAFNFEHA